MKGRWHEALLLVGIGMLVAIASICKAVVTVALAGLKF
jgi:hypothetical protein